MCNNPAKQLDQWDEEFCSQPPYIKLTNSKVGWYQCDQMS